jgi:hypothetical protein
MFFIFSARLASKFANVLILHLKFFPFSLTLIPPSGGLYGSQFLVGKLFEVHNGYENETIIYSSIFYADS